MKAIPLPDQTVDAMIWKGVINLSRPKIPGSRVALDYVPREELTDDFRLLRPRDGVGSSLSLDMHHSPVQVPPRIHLDLYTEDQAGEVERGAGETSVRISIPIGGRR